MPCESIRWSRFATSSTLQRKIAFDVVLTHYHTENTAASLVPWPGARGHTSRFRIAQLSRLQQLCAGSNSPSTLAANYCPMRVHSYSRFLSHTLLRFFLLASPRRPTGKKICLATSDHRRTASTYPAGCAFHQLALPPHLPFRCTFLHFLSLLQE